jgi:hypothetical protein
MTEHEMYIFIKEIGRLLLEYHRAEEMDLKHEIEKDIKLLSEVIGLS